jgi:predicted DNA-binding ribbon-helix-helix protein
MARPTEARLPAQGTAIVKRSLAIAGHRTSVSLEEAFWRALKDLATKRGQSMSALVAAIDAERQTANLSSAIRVYLLAALTERQ